MSSKDPWSRPSISDLKEVLASLSKEYGSNHRAADRLELSVPAEITTQRGNTVSAVTREISRFGIGLLHRGPVSLGEVKIRMASETREFEYHADLKWCTPCENGMFISGGPFLTSDVESKS